jgi:hypothetical protein
MNNFHRAVRLAGLNLLLVVVILISLEIAVRLSHPEISEMGTDRNLIAANVYLQSPGLKPHATGRCYGALFRVDANGFIQYAAQFDSVKPAWLLLGDSVTMGIGVSPDSTFAGRLAAVIDSCNIINPSLIGYSSKDYLRLATALLAHAPSYKIHRLSVFWCINDVYSDLPVMGLPGREVRHWGGEALNLIKRTFMTFQWFKALFYDRSQIYYEHDRRFYAAANEHLRAALQDLSRLEAICREYQVRFDLVLVPYEYQWREAKRGDWLPQTVLQENLRGGDIYFYDPANFLMKSSNGSAELYRFGDGIHFSPAGHAVMADFIRSQMAAR